MESFTRSSGILLHITSLPDRYGIGCMGSEAREFVDFLKKSGQKLWQICPLGPTGYGDSPYQVYSAYAGNPLIIDLDQLVRSKLLLTSDLADAPVEPVQAHAMRVGDQRGALGHSFRKAWRPDLLPLLNVVMAENRRYLKVLVPGWLKELELKPAGDTLDCSEEFRQITGLHYVEMVTLAEKAQFRHALTQIAETIADTFSDVVEAQPLLHDLSAAAPTWDELNR